MIANANLWQTNPPDTAGRWEMRCDETNREPQTVLVFSRDGRLWVDDPDVGTNPLPHYHGGLCSIQWRKCDPVAEAAYRELLTMPAPQTANGFRQAIVMAVLIGRQIEADFQQQQTTKPVGQDNTDELP